MDDYDDVLRDIMTDVLDHMAWQGFFTRHSPDELEEHQVDMWTLVERNGNDPAASLVLHLRDTEIGRIVVRVQQGSVDDPESEMVFIMVEAVHLRHAIPAQTLGAILSGMHFAFDETMGGEDDQEAA